METENQQPLLQRFGKSPFWIRMERDTQSFVPNFRTLIFYRAPRRRTDADDLPILDISPLHPILTLIVAGESFPLNILEHEFSGRGSLILTGSRKMMLKSTHTVDWGIRIKPTATAMSVNLNCQVKMSFDPPLPASIRGNLRLELYSPIHKPEIWSFPYAPESYQNSQLLWAQGSGLSVSIVVPDVAIQNGSNNGQADALPQKIGAYYHTIEQIVRRSRCSYEFGIQLDYSEKRIDALLEHMRHTNKSLPPSLPVVNENNRMSLRERATRAMQYLSDKGSYSVVGVERVYVKRTPINPLQANRSGDATVFYAGFPHFPLDAAKAMLDWHHFFGDDEARRLAELIAHGIATDFTVIANRDSGGINKGAFWDMRSGTSTERGGRFSDFLGDDFHSIASTSRIARALFEINNRNSDLPLLNAALNACQWLLLKQNDYGYFDGDRVDATTGMVLGGPETAAGVEAITPLLLAYRATKNEVFMKASARILRYVISTLVPSFNASPIYRTKFERGDDSPVTVAALVRSLALVYTESATQRLFGEIEVCSTWLRSWCLARWDESFNMDGAYSGAYEIARAALALLTITRDPSWLRMALTMGAAIPDEGLTAWQSIPLFIETMVGITSLIPNAIPDVNDYSVKIGWFPFTPDPMTNPYVHVVLDDDDDSGANIDYLPLVSRTDSRLLVIVLADRPVKHIRINQNGRFPNARDLSTGELECQPLSVHQFPFESNSRWGCFVIEP